MTPVHDLNPATSLPAPEVARAINAVESKLDEVFPHAPMTVSGLTVAIDQLIQARFIELIRRTVIVNAGSMQVPAGSVIHELPGMGVDMPTTSIPLP